MSQGPSLPLILPLELTKPTAGTATNAPAPPRNYLSGMARRHLNTNNDPHYPHGANPEPWKPTRFFFYNTLMDDQQLQKVLHLDSPPVLRPASVVGYSIKLWGPYPALVNGPPGNIVNGVVYEVQKEEHEKRLSYYESDAYRCVACSIKSGEGGEEFSGKTYVWADDPNDEDLSVGNFDFEGWKKARSASA